MSGSGPNFRAIFLPDGANLISELKLGQYLDLKLKCLVKVKNDCKMMADLLVKSKFAPSGRKSRLK